MKITKPLVLKAGILLIVVTLFLLLIISLWQRKTQLEKQYKYSAELYWGQQFVTSHNVELSKDSANIPFLTLCVYAGCDVKWIGNQMVTISYHEQKYILDIENISLVAQGDSYNCLVPAPGSTNYYFCVIDKEVVLDHITTMYALREMGIVVQFEFDLEEKSVTVIPNENLAV